MTPIARSDWVPEGQARGIAVEDGGRRHELILVRRGGRVFAYLNSCPHIGTPLETFPDRFLDRSGTRLLCSTHGAQFRIEDGYCVSGPCAGRKLTAVDVAVSGDEIVLAAPVPPLPAPVGDRR